MTQTPDIAGAAALAICESLMLALNDRNILPEPEIMGVLADAAKAHADCAAEPNAEPHHAAVATLIKRIITGGNSVRRT